MGGHEFRAVIVDEWPMLRAGVATVVTSAGGRVVAQSADPASALAEVRSHRPDLLVIGDHGVPANDIFTRSELVRRAISIVPELHCIALLDGAVADEFRSLSAAGVHAALPRTVDSGELASTIARVLDGERVVSPLVASRLFEVIEGGTAGDGDGAGLTTKEREVLRLLAAGRSNAEIAAALVVSPATVKTHLAHIYDKLEVRGRHEALSRAVALGLVG